MSDRAGTDRGFPGGRAKLPFLGSPPAAAPRVRLAGVGPRPDAATDDDAPTDDAGGDGATGGATDHGRSGGFDAYFSYESLFEGAAPAATVRGEAEAHRHLGLEAGAPWEEVVAAYRRLVKLHHPDRHLGEPPALRRANTERFHQIQEAFGRLEAAHRELRSG